MIEPLVRGALKQLILELVEFIVTPNVDGVVRQISIRKEQQFSICPRLIPSS